MINVTDHDAGGHCRLKDSRRKRSSNCQIDPPDSPRLSMSPAIWRTADVITVYLRDLVHQLDLIAVVRQRMTVTMPISDRLDVLRESPEKVTTRVNRTRTQP
jgi:hypothetical protein